MQAVDYAQDAARWVAVGRLGRAAALYQVALKLSPDDVGVRMQLAACLTKREQPEAAAHHYVEVARRCVAQRALDEALIVARRILQLDPAGFSGARMSELVLAIGRKAVPLCRKAARLHRKAGRNDRADSLLQLCAQLESSPARPRLVACPAPS